LATEISPQQEQH